MEFELSGIVLAYMGFEIFVAIACIAGNLLVVLAFCCERYIRTVTNTYMFSLAITDLLLWKFENTLKINQKPTKLIKMGSDEALFPTINFLNYPKFLSK